MERNDAENLVADGLVSVKEAAAFLKISVAKLYALMERGELVYAKLGKSRRIPRRAVVDLAARNLVGAYSLKAQETVPPAKRRM